MENDRKKIKEPFEPENTPKPPQIIDPEERNERRNTFKEKPGKSGDKKQEPVKGRPELLGDHADIDDETTI